MTDEHERAMKVWREACDAYEEGAATDTSLPMRDMVIAGDQAAAAVIAADRAGLVAEVERLREALLWYERQTSDYRKITTEGDDARYALERDGGTLARAALKDTRHDAGA